MNEVKPILHLKIKQRGLSKDNAEFIRKNIDKIRKNLSDDYHVVCTPEDLVDMSLINRNELGRLLVKLIDEGTDIDQLIEEYQKSLEDK